MDCLRAFQKREGSYARSSSKANEELGFSREGALSAPGRRGEAVVELFVYGTCGTGFGCLSDGFHKVGIDHNILVDFSDNPHGIKSLLDPLHLTHHDFSQHDDAAIRRSQTFTGPIGDRSLSFPRHLVLSLNFIHAEFRVGMKRVRRVLVRLNILHRRFIILYDGSIFIWKKSHKINLGMGIIHWYSDLSHVSLAQNVGENDRVLIYHTVSVE